MCFSRQEQSLKAGRAPIWAAAHTPSRPRPMENDDDDRTKGFLDIARANSRTEECEVRYFEKAGSRFVLQIVCANLLS